ncbi:MAG: hypothetical protein JW833_08245 [Prolixibacteraceae bacterium]|nr:hypothetical protein [Prolixibacteraceae bacterium]
MAFQTQILFEEPGKYKTGEYPYLGASPKFVSFLKDFLIKKSDKIESVKLAVYLFNNIELHKTFIALAEKNINIDVFSIPLEGYDDSSPQEISSLENEGEVQGKHTKKSLAEKVYRSFITDPVKGYNLNIFPHAYIRSSRIKPFSRGKIPYSLHTKSLLIEMKNGSALVGLSSSNMAVRDLPKHDFFILKPGNQEEIGSVKEFFRLLSQYSVPVSVKTDGAISFDFQIKQEKVRFKSDVFFISPFYINSPEIAENKISELIKSAKKRIWLMAQHISSYQYKIPLNYRIRKQINAVQLREGCLTALLEKGKQGLEIRCLSQTFVDENEHDGKYRVPVNTYNFSQFIKEFKKIPHAKYGVNENIHSKFLIIDDIVIATSFNFTPTQFISLPYVNISKFDHIPGLNYRGIFSEVGQMLILRSIKDVECFEKNFEYVWGDNETKVVIGN